MASTSTAPVAPARRALSRLLAAPHAPSPRGPPFERPLPILVAWLAAALVLMVWGDLELARWMRQFPEPLRPAVERITLIGEGVEVLVVTGSIAIIGLLLPVLGWRHRRRTALEALHVGASYVFLSVAGGGLTALLIKYSIGRARPLLMDTHDHLTFHPLAWQADFSAFPSGHSATAGAMALSLALVFPLWRAPILATGIVVALSRQLVGAHWPSDTLMGFGLGVAFAYAIAHVFARRRLLFRYESWGSLRRRRLPHWRTLIAR